LANTFSLDLNDRLQECSFSPLHYQFYAGEANEKQIIALMDKLITKQGVLRSAFSLQTGESNYFMDGAHMLMYCYSQ